MSNPSYYFTLFKKFQCLGHVPEASDHGSMAPPKNVDFRNPVTLYSASRTELGFAPVPLIGTGTGNTPLWMVLNAKVMGQFAFQYPAGGPTWIPMPQGSAAAAAWADPTVGGAPLVAAFSAWLTAGKPQDTPAFIVLPNGGTVPAPLDPGVAVFVCSAANDNGTRPGTVPNDFWNSSLIYLVDPSNGNQANPPTLHGAQEYYVAAVIGNRGNAVGGKYGTGPATAVSPGVQATAWALTFGTGGASPAVQLPSLSNLSVTSQSGINDVYFLPAGGYDIVGFRFPVQRVFDGLVHAIDDAVANGVFALPVGVTAEQWLKTPPSHVCLKVAARRDNEAWPPYDASPRVERRIAQKNLVVFDVDLAAPSDFPNVKWKYFTVGSPLAALMRPLRPFDRDLGLNTLVLTADFPRGAARVLLAVPRTTFERWIGKDGLRGFKIVERDGREEFRVPFDDHVVLEQTDDKGAIRVPGLDDNVLAMAIGVQIDQERLKPEAVHRVTLVHQAVVPRFGAGKESRCYELENAIVGGFTLEFRIDRSEAPKR